MVRDYEIWLTKCILPFFEIDHWLGTRDLKQSEFTFCVFFHQAAIRKELNEFKSTEMEVHEESRQFTR